MNFRLEEFPNQIINQKLQIQHLQNVIIAKVKMIETMENDKRNMTAAKTNVDFDLKRVQTELNDQKKINDELKKELDAMTASNSLLGMKYEKLKKNFAEAETYTLYLKSYKTKANNIEANLQQLQTDLQLKQELLDASSSENFKLKADLASIDKKYRDLEFGLKKKLENSSKSLKRRGDKIRKLEKAIKSMNEDKEKLTELEHKLKYFKQKEKTIVKNFTLFKETVLSGMSQFNRIIQAGRLIDEEEQMETDEHLFKIKQEDKNN